MNIAVAVLLLWVAPVFIAYRIGESKDRPSGLALGIFLGWLGVLIVALLPYRGQRCPDCAEMIRLDAQVCRYCGWRGSAPELSPAELLRERVQVALDRDDSTAALAEIDEFDPSDLSGPEKKWLKNLRKQVASVTD